VNEAPLISDLGNPLAVHAGIGACDDLRSSGTWR
jgi:hypothetical protein